MKNDKLNIVIVEDSAFIQEWLKSVISNFENFNLMYSINNADDAVNFINANKPDIIILDMKLVESTGITVLKKVRKNLPNTIIIVYTNYDDYKMQCKIMGSDYFIDKSDEGKDLIKLLNKIHSGEIIIQEKKSMINELLF
jgi:DNA-binding NarL/FixJ family response regulator